MTFFITPFHYTDCFSVRQIGYGGKDKTGEIPKYVCFFKARDADALTSAFNAYTADVLKSKEKPSVLKQLSKLKEIVAALPAKVLQKQKERVQDR